MPIELFLSPIMKPIVQAQSALMGVHRSNNSYTPTIINLLDNTNSYLVRKEFGTGSKTFSVFGNSDPNTPQSYEDRLYNMNRSRAVKGAYKMYMRGDDKPIGALRAGLRSNVMLLKTATGDELELGWHVMEHKVDALDHYRTFQLSDGYIYHWTTKGQFLERVRNAGQRDAEVRERVGQVRLHPNRRGFDLAINESEVHSLEMVIATALICYIESWNTERAYGGIYDAKKTIPAVWWQRQT